MTENRIPTFQHLSDVLKTDAPLVPETTTPDTVWVLKIERYEGTDVHLFRTEDAGIAWLIQWIDERLESKPEMYDFADIEHARSWINAQMSDPEFAIPNEITRYLFTEREFTA